jgi:hypothetical protein
MAQPTTRQVHVDRPLTAMSVAYMQEQSDFIADQVFPVVPVDKQSDLYYVYDKNDWFRDEAADRAPGTESAGGGYNLSTTPYSCRVVAYHKDIDDQTRDNADDGIDLERDATEFSTHKILLRRERNWATNFFGTGIWGTDITGVASAPGAGQTIHWSNYTTSDPVTDIETGKRTIKINTGRTANTLVLGYDVFRFLKRHPTVRDQYKYVNSDVITAQMLARMFEVERVLVAGAVYATNDEGATGAYDFVHGKRALLCHVAPRPGLLVPSAGYMFGWRGVSRGNGTTVAIKRFRMENLESDRVEAQAAYDPKVVGADLGYFWDAIVA